MHKTTTQIFDEATQSELIELGDHLSVSKFSIGWRLAEIIDEHDEEGDDITAADVYHAAAKYVRATERTLRYYTEIARRFDQSLVSLYLERYPSLSFSHYATARKRKYQDDGLWLRYLAYAGEGQYAPDVAESMFDNVNAGKIPVIGPGAPPNERDVKSFFYGSLRRIWGEPNIPAKFAFSMIDIWKQIRALIREIQDSKKED